MLRLAGVAGSAADCAQRVLRSGRLSSGLIGAIIRDLQSGLGLADSDGVASTARPVDADELPPGGWVLGAKALRAQMAQRCCG